MLKKFWLCLSLATIFIFNPAYAEDISESEAEEVDRATRPYLYPEEEEPEVGQDLCDPNNPNSENCNLFQIQNGKAQSAFSNGKKSKAKAD